MRRLASAVLLALCLLAPMALAAVTEDELRPRFIARDADLAKLKADKVIGENVTGMIDVVDTASAPPAAKALVDAENADSQQLYQLIAARLSAGNPDQAAVTVEAVARENAMRLFMAAPPGELWKTRDGSWRAR